MWDKVKEIYKEHDREEDILLNANMLWILRADGEYFDEEKI